MATENVKTKQVNERNYHISSLLRKLKSSSPSSVQKALISLSRATRKTDNVVKLRNEGGIKILLTFLESSNKKSLDMAVSVLANCALESQCKTEIKQLNGLALLCNLLASLADTSILSRVTRALANLSQDLSIANEISNLDAVSKLFGIIKELTDTLILQNTLRALRIMSQSYVYIKQLTDNKGILALVELLKKENGNEVKCSCLQTLLELTKAANGGLATQFQEYGAIEVVSQLSYSDDKDVVENCINILCTLTKYFSVRVSVGTMGGVEAFLHQIKERGPMLLPSIKSICLCCREAVNRNKIRSAGGINDLIGILGSPEYSQVYDDILGAFACFTYDDLALRLMIDGGLIAVLVSMLQKLLFPENTMKVAADTQDTDLPVASNQMVATTIPQMNTTLKSSESMPSATRGSARSIFPGRRYPAFKTHVSARSVSPDKSYPTSPPSCISPNLSPELRLPYTSPCSPESARSSSPMVYSPSGSEVEDNDSSESDDNIEEDAIENAEQNDELVGGENSSPNNNSANSNENLLNSLMEDLATARSRNIAISPKMFQKLGETKRQRYQRLQNEERSFPYRANKTGVPLLPGNRHSEHLRLFLSEENLFSADQPSPTKFQSRGADRFSWMQRRKSHDSLSTSNTPNPPSRPSPSYTSSLQTFENKIIYLLSRFGQLPDIAESEALTSPECMQTLLDYLCYSKNPDQRCYRLLTRLAWDIKFFETLIVTMFPGAVYRQLICGLRPGYLLSGKPQSSAECEDKERQPSVQLPENSPRAVHTLASVKKPEDVVPLGCESSTGTGVSKFPNDNIKESSVQTPETSQITTHSLVCVKEPAQSSPSGNRSSAVSSGQMTSGNASASDLQTSSSKRSAFDVIEDNQVGSNFSNLPVSSKQQKAENVSRNHTEHTGKSILSVMTTQASMPFGEGNLAHLLRRGTQKQKEACALSLPYLCKSVKMKQKLLVDYKGLMVIFSILCHFKEQQNVIRAIHSIAFLIKNSAMKMESDFHVFIAKDEKQFLIRRRCVVEDLPSTNTQNAGECLADRSSSPANNSGNVRTAVFGKSRKINWLSNDNGANISTKSTSKRDGNAAKTVFKVCLQSTPKEEKSEDQQKSDRLTCDERFARKLTRGIYRRTGRSLKNEIPYGLVYESYHSMMRQGNCDSATITDQLFDPHNGVMCKRTKVEPGSSELETCCGKCSYTQTDSTPFDVVIKVDTGESIEAHRSVLCDSSEVFAAMLSSNFVEANQQEVLVRDLNHTTALFFVHYAYGCSWSFEHRFAACPVLEESLCCDSSIDFDFLLELLACTDQFLLTNLKKQCVQLLMFYLSNEQAVDAYLAAVFYNAPLLRLYSLKYIFLGKIELECAYNCLRRLLQSQEKDRVIEDLKNIGLDCCASESDY